MSDTPTEFLSEDDIVRQLTESKKKVIGGEFFEEKAKTFVQKWSGYVHETHTEEQAYGNLYGV